MFGVACDQDEFIGDRNRRIAGYCLIDGLPGASVRSDIEIELSPPRQTGKCGTRQRNAALQSVYAEFLVHGVKEREMGRWHVEFMCNASTVTQTLFAATREEILVKQDSTRQTESNQSMQHI